MPRTDPTTIIVGAGPAGVSLAYLLASRGVSVTLLEQHNDFARAFRGEILLPSGFEALQQMGLAELIKRIPHSAPTAFELYANGARMFVLRMNSKFFDYRPLTALSQPDFLEAVVNVTKTFPCFRLELGATVTGLVRTNGRVSGVTLRTQTGTRTLQASLIIGTDGRHSVVRKSCQLNSQKHGLDVDVIWFKMPAPDFFLNPTSFRGYVGRAHLLLAYPAPDGLLQVACLIQKNSYAEFRRRHGSAWIEEIARNVSPDLATHFRSHQHSIGRLTLLSAISDRVTDWSVRGALVIGDAAHTMSPVGGQGINIALRDAIVAANHLVPVFRSTPSDHRIDVTARAIGLERTAELAHIQRLQAFPPRVLMGRSWLSAAVRATMPRLLRFSAVRTMAAPLVRTLLLGQGDVQLRV